MVGPRVFSLEQAQALIPELEQVFAALDLLRARLKTDKVKLSALEMIWGAQIQQPDCPDHAEAAALVAQLKQTQEEAARLVEQLAGLGATVKDVHLGLADLYHVRDGRLVFLCWKRGETAITTWHHVDEGYADRQPL